MIERGKLARELHDGTVQMLLLLSIKLNEFEKKTTLNRMKIFKKSNVGLVKILRKGRLE
ncbi:histidine kinase [Priestia aryabhattai]|nr:histidine kinase [Priestia aryabhattai]MCE4093203.1 histidine kinase dimerization/phosphoacceptor domain-containing protein [Priestia megaterium]MED3821847.1 histidine kinase [Priestia aryabhattai]